MNNTKKYHSKSYNLIIIGAGASGLMCAIRAGERGLSVLMIEKADKIGKKILISGGGRCNFTNLDIDPTAYISNVPRKNARAIVLWTKIIGNCANAT